MLQNLKPIDKIGDAFFKTYIEQNSSFEDHDLKIKYKDDYNVFKNECEANEQKYQLYLKDGSDFKYFEGLEKVMDENLSQRGNITMLEKYKIFTVFGDTLTF